MNTAAVIMFICLQAVLVLLVTASKTKSEVTPDPETIEYLDQLYQTVEELHRPLVEGEMNLLPEGVQGFANSVMCFSDLSASAVSDNSRELRFDLSNNLADDEIIAAIDLVLKQAPGAAPYETHLHEITGDNFDELKLLDSGVTIGEWHTLNVRNFMDNVDSANGKRNYRLQLSVSGGDSQDMDNLLHRIKPMLLIYTNDFNRTTEDPMTNDDYPSGRVPGSSRSKDSRSRSQEEDDAHSGESSRRRHGRSISGASGSSVTLDQIRTQPCTVHERTVTYPQLGWPGASNVVTSGNIARFAFCYGSCNDPYSSTVKYTNHAKMIGITQPRLANIAPCCVAEEYLAVPITYYSRGSGILLMTTYPIARSCRCM